ncbi:MAG: T9SS type A sorting domain-containing protein [Prolixibacteraceae bacterium]
MKKYILISILILLIGLQSNGQIRHPLYPTDTNVNGLQSLISDFGPRYYSTSLFHRGLDYQNSTNVVAYEVEGGILNFVLDATQDNSYMNIGNWTYLHVLIGSDDLLKWSLTPNPNSGNNYVLLETVDINGNPKIFVNSSNELYLGVERETFWDEIAITTRDVELGDVVFRSNSLNHLHFQYGIGDAAYTSPLAYIFYEGDGSNSMNLNLSFKYNRSGIATFFPIENIENNINKIYGSAIIIETKVEYQNELDLQLVQVDISKVEDNYFAYANWKYSGSGHMNYISRSAGTSSVSHHCIHYVSQTDGDYSPVMTDVREGIFPLNTTRTHDLGGDILKKYFNSQENWNTTSPTYPDGQYKFRITTEDVRGNQSTPVTATKIIDNFKPYVKQVKVTLDSENSSSIAYNGIWNWNSSGNLYLSTNGSGCYTNDDVWVHVYTSEPMSSLLVEINEVFYYPIKRADDHWVVNLSGTELADFNSIVVKSSSLDLAGNGLFGFTSGTTYLNGTSLPKRNNLGIWSSSAIQDDKVHQFGAYYPNQIVCHMPPDYLSAIYDPNTSSVDVIWPSAGTGAVYRVYRSNSPDMANSIELTSDWITGTYLNDPLPVFGMTNYYAVEAGIESADKSSSIDCQYIEDAVFVANESSGLVEIFPGWYGNNDILFYLYIESDYDNLTYRVDMDFGDNEVEHIEYYYSGDIVSHLYENNTFEELTFFPTAIVHVFSNGFDVEEINVLFDPVEIQGVDYELEVSIDNSFGMVGVNNSFTATCVNARPDVMDIGWDWCVGQISGSTSDCSSANGVIIHQSTAVGHSSIGASFPSPGQYLITLTVYDFYKTKTIEHIVNVSENCISSNINPYFDNYTLFPNDCPDNIEFTYVVPGNFIVGNCNGSNYYLWRVEIYIDNNLSAFRTIDFSNNYTQVANQLPVAKYSYSNPTYEWYNYLSQLRLDISSAPFNGYLDYNTIRYKVYGKKYHLSSGTFIDDELSNERSQLFNRVPCESSLYCSTLTILSTQISYYQYLPIEHHYGHYIFEGDVCKILNVNNYSVVARKSVLLKSGVKISNSNFKASVIPCDYAPCNYLKSSPIADHLLNVGPTIAQNLGIYPNPVCDFLNVEISEIDQQADLGISIYDMTGKMVKNLQAKGGIHVLEVSELLQGSYIVSVGIKGQVFNRKFIKE